VHGPYSAVLSHHYPAQPLLDFVYRWFKNNEILRDEKSKTRHKRWRVNQTSFFNERKGKNERKGSGWWWMYRISSTSDEKITYFFKTNNSPCFVFVFFFLICRFVFCFKLTWSSIPSPSSTAVHNTTLDERSYMHGNQSVFRQ